MNLRQSSVDTVSARGAGLLFKCILRVLKKYERKRKKQNERPSEAFCQISMFFRAAFGSRAPSERRQCQLDDSSLCFVDWLYSITLARDLRYNDLKELPSGLFDSLTALSVMCVRVLIMQGHFVCRKLDCPRVFDQTVFSLIYSI